MLLRALTALVKTLEPWTVVEEQVSALTVSVSKTVQAIKPHFPEMLRVRHTGSTFMTDAVVSFGFTSCGSAAFDSDHYALVFSSEIVDHLGGESPAGEHPLGDVRPRLPGYSRSGSSSVARASSSEMRLSSIRLSA